MRNCADGGSFFLKYFDNFCSILNGFKYYPPSLALFSVPFPVSDSLGNRLNSKLSN